MGSTFLVNLILIPVIIKYLGNDQFGIYVLLQTILLYFSALDLGLTPTITKFSAELSAEKEKNNSSDDLSYIFTLLVVIGGVVLLIVIGFAYFLNNIFSLGEEKLNFFRAAFLITGIQLSLNVPFSIWKGILTGAQEFNLINAILIVNNFIKLLLTYILLKNKYGLISLLILGFSVVALEWLTTLFYVHKKIPSLRLSLKKIRYHEVEKIFKFSGVMFLWGFASRTLAQFNKFLLALSYPISSLAYFEGGARLNEYSKNAMSSILFSILPMSSNLFAKNDTASIKSLYLYATKIVFFLYGCLSLMMFIYADQFIFIWLGADFIKTGIILKILLVGSLFQSQNAVAHIILAGMNKLRLISKIMIGYIVLTLVFGFFLIKEYGIMGAALAPMITCIIVESFCSVYIFKALEVRISDVVKAVHIPAIISLIPSVIISILIVNNFSITTWIEIAMCFSIFFIVSLISFYNFGFAKEQKKNIRIYFLDKLQINKK